MLSSRPFLSLPKPIAGILIRVTAVATTTSSPSTAWMVPRKAPLESRTSLPGVRSAAVASACRGGASLRLARGVGEGEGLVPGERMRGRRRAGGEGEAVQALPVSDGSVPPPARFLLLNGEEGGDLFEALRVDLAGQPRPLPPHCADGGDSAVVAEDELVPEGAARPHRPLPRRVVEPEEVVLGLRQPPRSLRRVLG